MQDWLARLFNVGNEEILTPRVTNPVPYSAEEAERRKKRVQEMLSKPQEPEENLLEKIKSKLMPEVSIQGVGTNQEDLSYLSDKPAQNDRQPAPRQVAQPEPRGMSWEQAGRAPSNPYAELMKQAFGEKAQEFEDILRWGNPDDQGYGYNYGGENLDYNAEGVNYNDDGSVDTGLFQINSNTFEDFMRRKPERLAAYGIGSYNDMRDPLKNMMMAKIIYDEQGAKAWYGSKHHRKTK